MCSIHAFLSDVKLQMLYINSRNPFPLIFSSVNYLVNVDVLTSFSTFGSKAWSLFYKRSKRGGDGPSSSGIL